MLIFKNFFRQLAKKEDVDALDAQKNKERELLKNQWIDRVSHDTYLDDIIFGYTDIFPVDEQTALANAGSKDHLDILVAAGINIPPSGAAPDKPGNKESAAHPNPPSHQLPANVSKAASMMPPLAPKGKKGALVKQRDQRRNWLSRADWEAIFEEMMRRDLIDLPDSYYQESEFFKRPEELTNQFTQREQDNLFCIHRSQEAQEQYEQERRKLADREEKMGAERDELKKNELELFTKISTAKEMFSQLQQSNIMSFMIVPQENKKKLKLLDQDKLLEDLKGRMIEQWQKFTDVDNSGKDPIDILQEIQEKLSEQLEFLKKVERDPRLEQAEKEVKAEWKRQSRLKRTAQNQAEQELKKLDNEKRAQRKFVREGKVVQHRSEKKIFERKFEPAVINQEEVDMLKYVGDL